ncbi:1002_t:CDS:2, partial [Gigaspora rosea]
LANKIEESNDPALYNFSYDILANISNSDWWKLLKQLENLLKPYCSALNKLQTDKARLYEVLYTFGWITRIVKGLIDSDLRNFLLNHLERRHWMVYYYQAWFLEPQSILLLELQEYMDQRYPFDN